MTEQDQKQLGNILWGIADPDVNIPEGKH